MSFSEDFKSLVVLGLAKIYLVYTLVFSFFRYFPNFWLSELWLSFLPQFTLIGGILGIIFFSLLIKEFFIDHKAKIANFSHKFVLPIKVNTLILVILTFVPYFFSASKVFSFFYSNSRIVDFEVTQANPQENIIKIVFANIYENNWDLNDLNQNLKKLNPDIVAFAEFRNPQLKELDFLNDLDFSFPTKFDLKNQENKPNIVLFSKFSIKQAKYFKLKENLSLVAEIDCCREAENLQLEVVHLSSPKTPALMHRRNRDLEFLNEKYSNQLQGQNRILVGDFNVSPFSAYKPDFAEMKEVFYRKGLYYTWSSQGFKSVIDYLYLSKNIKVNETGIIELQGSDHNLLWAEFSLY